MGGGGWRVGGWWRVEGEGGGWRGVRWEGGRKGGGGWRVEGGGGLRAGGGRGKGARVVGVLAGVKEEGVEVVEVKGGWTCASSRCCCLLLIAWFLIEWIMYADRFSIASSCVRRSHSPAPRAPCRLRLLLLLGFDVLLGSVGTGEGGGR